MAWCVENGVKDYDFIEDNLTIGRIPEKRIKALLEPIKHGDTLGRPMGARRKLEKIVLYGKTEELERLHAQGLSPQRIADALHVSRGTVANYLQANGLKRNRKVTWLEDVLRRIPQ